MPGGSEPDRITQVGGGGLIEDRGSERLDSGRIDGVAGSADFGVVPSDSVRVRLVRTEFVAGTAR